MDLVTIIDQDIIYQYSDGRELLSESLAQRKQLLKQIEQIARVYQECTSVENVPGFPLGRVQALLFELSVIGEYIDTLIAEINSYAERCGKPRVYRTDMLLH